MNKLADKSRDTKFGAKDVHAGADNVWSEQSDKHKYLRHCHFSSGREWMCDVKDDIEEVDKARLE